MKSRILNDCVLLVKTEHFLPENCANNLYVVFRKRCVLKVYFVWSRNRTQNCFGVTHSGRLVFQV